MFKSLFFCFIILSSALLLVEAHRQGRTGKRGKKAVAAGAKNSGVAVVPRSKTTTSQPAPTTLAKIYAMSTGVQWSKVGHSVDAHPVAPGSSIERLRFPVYVKIVPVNSDSTNVSTSPFVDSAGILINKLENKFFKNLSWGCQSTKSRVL